MTFYDVQKPYQNLIKDIFICNEMHSHGCLFLQFLNMTTLQFPRSIIIIMQLTINFQQFSIKVNKVAHTKLCKQPMCHTKSQSIVYVHKINNKHLYLCVSVCIMLTFQFIHSFHLNERITHNVYTPKYPICAHTHNILIPNTVIILNKHFNSQCKM